MTVPTNTYQTYQTVGIREDLIDLVYSVDPTSTPLLSMAGKAKATQTKHEWQDQALAAANTGNAQIEGDDATADAQTPTTRLNNQTQISRKVVQVSGTDQAVKAAGQKNILGWRLLNAAKELKRDMEAILGANQAINVGSASVARTLGAFDAWLATNTVILGTGGANGGSGTTARTDGSPTVAVTEANVKTVLADIYKSTTRSPDYCILSPANKQLFSSFTGNVTRFVDVEGNDAKLVTAYEIYVSDFGDVKIVPDVFTRGRDIFFINSEYYKIAYLRPFETIALSKTGDSDRKALYAEYTLEMSAEKAHGGIFDTTG